MKSFPTADMRAIRTYIIRRTGIRLEAMIMVPCPVPLVKPRGISGGYDRVAEENVILLEYPLILLVGS
jgi:hypothetical protein